MIDEMDLLAIGYLGLDTLDLEAWRPYATEVMGFGIAGASDDETLLLRMDDRRHRIALHAGDREGLAYIGWELRSRPEFEAAVGELDRAGLDVIVGDDALADRRGVHAVAYFSDPAGYRHEIFYGQEFLPHSFVPGRPFGGFLAGETGIGHVVLAVPEVTDELKHFASVILGLSWAGQGSRKFSAFYRPSSNTRSHTIAYAGVPGHFGLHHVGIEVNELDDVGIAYDLVRRRELSVQMTLGRHTQDPVISFYHFSPTGTLFEYLTGGDVVTDASYVESRPSDLSLWGHELLVPGLPGTVHAVAESG